MVAVRDNPQTGIGLSARESPFDSSNPFVISDIDHRA